MRPTVPANNSRMSTPDEITPVRTSFCADVLIELLPALCRNDPGCSSPETNCSRFLPLQISCPSTRLEPLARPTPSPARAASLRYHCAAPAVPQFQFGEAMNAHSLLHRPRPGVFFAAVLLLSLHPLHGQAPDSQTFRAGATSIAIPPPAGLTETGSDYRVLLEFLAPDNNRLVAAFVLPDDWKVLHGGNAPPMSTYALAEVPRR